MASTSTQILSFVTLRTKLAEASLAGDGVAFMELFEHERFEAHGLFCVSSALAAGAAGIMALIALKMPQLVD